MTKGEHSRITFAAGEHAYQPSSPLYAATGNNSVQLDIVLKDFDKLKNSWEMTFEEKLAAAEVAKQKGNAFFAVSFRHIAMPQLSLQPIIPAARRQTIIGASTVQTN
jgi:hypothetical protein